MWEHLTVPPAGPQPGIKLSLGWPPAFALRAAPRYGGLARRARRETMGRARSEVI